MENNNSYQKRIVSYEKIHSIDEKDFDCLVSVVDPKDGEVILDACCGYGAVSERLIKSIEKNNLNTKIVLLDSSELQLSRAKENLKDKDVDFVLSDAREIPFKENHFDTIVNKMGLHEVDKESQERMLKEFYRILKPGGKIVIWELALDEKTQPIFSKIIKKKDEIAGFDSLVLNRHFPRKEEVLSELQNSGFENTKVEHDVFPKLSVRNRKEEFVSAERLKIVKEKGSIEESDQVQLDIIAEQKIEEFVFFIKESLSEDEKKLMNYTQTENDIILTASKAIFSATKPI